MYLDVNDMLIAEKEIKKLSYNKENNYYYLVLVETDSPKFVKLSKDDCKKLMDTIMSKEPKCFCIVNEDIYFVPSIYDMSENNGVGYVYYVDGSYEKITDHKGYQKLNNLYFQYNNQEEYQI